MKAPLEKFGAFVVQNLRDKMLDDLEMLLAGKWKAPDLQELQRKLAQLSEDQKKLFRVLVEQITTVGMHDLLFAIQEQADTGAPIRVLVDDQEIAHLSDGLHGEIFGDEGWIVRYSKHASETEMQRSKWAKGQIQKMFGEKNDQKG